MFSPRPHVLLFVIKFADSCLIESFACFQSMGGSCFGIRGEVGGLENLLDFLGYEVKLVCPCELRKYAASSCICKFEVTEIFFADFITCGVVVTLSSISTAKVAYCAMHYCQDFFLALQISIWNFWGNRTEDPCCTP